MWHLLFFSVHVYKIIISQWLPCWSLNQLSLQSLDVKMIHPLYRAGLRNITRGRDVKYKIKRWRVFFIPRSSLLSPPTGFRLDSCRAEDGENSFVYPTTDEQKTEPCLFLLCWGGGRMSERWEGCLSNCTCGSVWRLSSASAEYSIWWMSVSSFHRQHELWNDRQQQGSVFPASMT